MTRIGALLSVLSAAAIPLFADTEDIMSSVGASFQPISPLESDLLDGYYNGYIHIEELVHLWPR